MKSLAHLPVRVAGLGSYLPENVLTNHDLEEMVDTSDGWITQRTGIRERRLASDDQATSDLAVRAARQALQDAGCGTDDVDAIICCTCTPDHLFPATACLVQDALGVEDALCYDLEAACSGFVFGLNQAAGLLAGGMAECVLVIGAETLSRFTDWEDRRSCILFGDGAGAAVVQNSEDDSAILYSELGADGSRPSILRILAGGARRPATRKTVDKGQHYMELKGREVFKWAVSKLGELVDSIPRETGISMDEVRLIVPHQSNERIIRSVCERAGLSQDRAYMNIDAVGNTSAASIPVAFEEAVQKGLVERGDLVLLLAFGGGVTWGSTLLRY